MASAIFHNSNVTVMKLKKLNLAATGGKYSQLKMTFCCSFKVQLHNIQSHNSP